MQSIIFPFSNLIGISVRIAREVRNFTIGNDKGFCPHMFEVRLIQVDFNGGNWTVRHLAVISCNRTETGSDAALLPPIKCQ